MSDSDSDPDPVIHLVDSHHGIYAYHSLVTQYPLFMDEGQPFHEWLQDNFPGETIETVFHPDNPHWCENIDWLESRLCVQNEDTKEFWPITTIEGDIYAVNPRAEWDDNTDQYVISVCHISMI